MFYVSIKKAIASIHKFMSHEIFIILNAEYNELICQWRAFMVRS